MQDSNSVMLEVTSIRNLRPREGREAMHLVFSPALFPPASGGLREGPFLASNIFCDSGRDRDFVSKEERLSSGYLFYIIYEKYLRTVRNFWIHTVIHITFEYLSALQDCAEFESQLSGLAVCRALHFLWFGTAKTMFCAKETLFFSYFKPPSRIYLTNVVSSPRAYQI